MKTLDLPVSFWISYVSEIILASFGLAVCIWATVTFALRQVNELWPLPGLYFLEIILFAAAALASRVLDIGAVHSDYGLNTWLAGGILVAFVILGGFSIGPYLFPAMLAFWLGGAIGDIRQRRRILKHLSLALLAGILQAGLMLILIRVPAPG